MSGKRGANGGGSIRRRGDGRWEGRCTVGIDSQTGKQVQRSVYGATQREVREKLSKLISAIDAGSYLAPNQMTVSQWLDMWLEEFLGNIKPHTRKSYTGVVNNHIKPMLGEIRLQRLDAVGVQRFVNSLAGITDEEKKLTPKTVKNIHGVLHSALQQAVRIGYIASNPADMTVLPRRKKPEISPLEERQVLSFLEMIRGHRYEYLYIMDLFTGLRQSELLGLQWRDIDFDRGHIVIRRQLQYLGHAHGGYQFLDMTKNGKDRCLELPNIVKEALRKQREWQLQMAAKLGDAWINKDDLVFTDVTGDHLKHDHVYRELKRIFKKMGVPNLRFHDLRHTYAVLCILAGIDFRTLQENMGHYSQAFSLDTYGHVVTRMRQQGAEKLDRYVLGLKTGLPENDTECKL